MQSADLAALTNPLIALTGQSAALLILRGKQNNAQNTSAYCHGMFYTKVFKIMYSFLF